MKIELNKSLKSLNSFGIDVHAAMFCTVNSHEEIREAIREGLFTQNFLIIGGGTNILFTHDFDGVVMHDRLKGMGTGTHENDDVYVTASAGEIWHDLVLFALDSGLGGIENLSLIPGTVGAAPIQNIGAYGVELTNVFHSLEAIDLTSGELRIFTKEECKFGYRNSIFKNEARGKYFITSVTLRLQKNPEINTSYGAIKNILQQKGIANPDIRDVSNAVIEIRQSKLPDPAVIGNAGSFFKNPEIPKTTFDELKLTFPEIPGYNAAPGFIKVPAGWLIEQCGWKGKRIGETGSHKDQALVLVNYGNANGNEIYKLAMNIKSSVKEKFGIEINPEVNIV